MEYYLTPKHYEIAKANGIKESTLYQRVYVHNWNIERAITQPTQKKNISGWTERKQIAEANGISRMTYMKRVQYGWDKDVAATKPVVTMKEKEKLLRNSRKRVFTEEQLERAAANGISSHRLHTRVYKFKWDVETAINTPILSEEEVIKRMTSVNSGFRDIHRAYWKKAEANRKVRD